MQSIYITSRFYDTSVIRLNHKYESDGGRACTNLATTAPDGTVLYCQYKLAMVGVWRSLGSVPRGVVALSRMVKVGDWKTSNLLKRNIVAMWKAFPEATILVSYSDSSLGHDGNVYKLSGFVNDQSRESDYYINRFSGERTSPFQNGHRNDEAIKAGTRILKRWIKHR